MDKIILLSPGVFIFRSENTLSRDLRHPQIRERIVVHGAGETHQSRNEVVIGQERKFVFSSTVDLGTVGAS